MDGGTTGLHPSASCLTSPCLPPICLCRPPLQVELEGGCLLDSLTLQDDYVELARNQGAHLRGQLLLVLGVRPAAGCHSGGTFPLVC